MVLVISRVTERAPFNLLERYNENKKRRNMMKMKERRSYALMIIINKVK